MKPPRITVLIPCKDERANIEQCIDSAQLVADEVLVADSGSRDGTVEIVRGRSDCRLIQREFIDYANFKNWAIPQASHPWVLILDADERVTREVRDEIKQVLSRVPRDVDGYWLRRRTFFMGHELRYCGWQTDKVLRLIRRDRCRYGTRRVHEEIEHEQLQTGVLKNRLLHYTYWTYDQYFAKYMRYVKWGAEDMRDRGRRAGWFSLLISPFLRFAQLYFLRRGFLDGLPGVQMCMLQAFFVSFTKQARLWEMEHARAQPRPALRTVSAEEPCERIEQPAERLRAAA
jgi:glycosyltransferase involved in cell wall biosynthesis